jgi:sporulation protein YlmC with PRC-barrel domain
MNVLRALSTATALALAGVAVAQAPPPPESRGTAAQPSEAYRTAADILDKHRATSVIGKNVDTPAGDNIGEIKDIVLDDSGKATHAIISYGGAAGINARQVAVPWKTVTSMVRKDRIVMNRSQLESAPVLPEAQPDFTSRDWSREIDRYWERVRSAAAEATDADEPSTKAPERR